METFQSLCPVGIKVNSTLGALDLQHTQTNHLLCSDWCPVTGRGKSRGKVFSVMQLHGVLNGATNSRNLGQGNKSRVWLCINSKATGLWFMFPEAERDENSTNSETRTYTSFPVTGCFRVKADESYYSFTGETPKIQLLHFAWRDKLVSV